MTRRPRLEDVGFSKPEVLALMTDVARHAAYQLASQETGVPMAALSESKSVVELLGKERWARLALFTLDTIRDTEIEVTVDERGPVVTLEEMNRQGALVLGQFLAGQEQPR